MSAINAEIKLNCSQFLAAIKQVDSRISSFRNSIAGAVTSLYLAQRAFSLLSGAASQMPFG